VNSESAELDPEPRRDNTDTPAKKPRRKGKAKKIKK